MKIDSFVVVISRKYPLEKCLKAIDDAIVPRKDLFLLLYLDTTDRSIIDYCEKWLSLQKDRWFSKEIMITNTDPIDVKRIEDYKYKWDRIINNLKEIIIHTDFSDIVFMVEDDTIIPRDAFRKLYRRIKKNEEIGCIQGVEAMRKAGGNGCCGSWKLNFCKKGKLKTKIGLRAKEKGIEEIDGGGYYCWAFRQKAIKQIELRYLLEGWCGPDVMTWYDIKQNGWKTLIDWSVWCNHIEDNGKVLTPEGTKNWLYDFSNGTYQSPKMNYDYEAM